MPELPDQGLIHVPSPHSVPETQKRLEALLLSKGLTIFARIDHSGEAAKVGLEMHPLNCSSLAARKAVRPSCSPPPLWPSTSH